MKDPIKERIKQNKATVKKWPKWKKEQAKAFLRQLREDQKAMTTYNKTLGQQ